MGILAGILLDRVQVYQAQAEKVTVEQVAAVVQNALTLQFGKFLTQGDEGKMEVLGKDNPMHWLARVPSNYQGEFYGITPSTLASGSWAFDLKTRDLVYKVMHDRSLTTAGEDEGLIRYRVHIQYENRPHKTERDAQEIVGVVFRPLTPYPWLD